MFTRKRALFCFTLLGVSLVGFETTCRAQDDSKLGVTLDATWVSRYLWRGYDVFDDHASFQPSVDIDLFGSGFSVNAWAAIPMGSGYENLTEYDYTVAYGTTLFEEEVYALDLGINYIYYDFPKVNSRAIPDTQEVGVSVALPNLIMIGDSALVPSYYVCKFWPSKSGVGFDVAGGYHTLGLSYDWTIPGTEQVLSLSTDVNYNDGLFGADHDWSHANLGISTSFNLDPFSVSPFLGYQISMDDSVNDEDELIGGVSVSISF